MLSIATPTTRQRVRIFGTCTNKNGVVTAYTVHTYIKCQDNMQQLFGLKKNVTVSRQLSQGPSSGVHTVQYLLIVVIKDLIKVIEFIPSKTILGSH